MVSELSSRLREIVDALPLESGMRVLEIGGAPVENFEIDHSVPLFDLAFACRVGAFDGRHPRLYDAALASVRRAVVPGGTLYIDTGSPLTPVALE